jgi:hypothetical protein
MKIRAMTGLLFGLISSFAGTEESPLIRYKVSPDPRGDRVSVEAVFRFQNNPVYLKDFGQIEGIRWLIDGKDTTVRQERSGDLLLFRDLPAFGEAKAVYTIKCGTEPKPGYRKRLMGSKDFIMAREGLFLGINGRELSDVDIQWDLPSGWRLILGRTGRATLADTQRTLWIAGRTAQTVEERIDGKIFRIGVLEGASALTVPKIIETAKAVFRLAWDHYGPLDDQEFGLAIFPHGSLGGGTALYSTLASEENPVTIVHEMLHWWTNFQAPAWFREGVHSYIVLKLLADNGIFDQARLQQVFKELLQERMRVVQREGKVYSLAESSAAYDRNAGGGDIYALGPLFAYKLDREIQGHNAGTSLEAVFSEVSRARWRRNTVRPKESSGPIDIVKIIKEKTGFNAEPLFEKFFSAIVEDPGVLLK